MEKEQKIPETVENNSTPVSAEVASDLEAAMLQGTEEVPVATSTEVASVGATEQAPLMSVEEEEEGADLMQQFMDGSFEQDATYEIGEKISARVVSLGKQYVFLDVGSKSEASIALEQLLADGGEAPKVGDMVDAFVVNINSGNLELGLHLPGGEDAMFNIEEAQHNQIPVEGSVKGVNKGGLDVEIFGKRAFCPISQIESGFCEDTAQYVGQTLTFRVMEIKEGGRNIVVSRKVLLQEIEKEAAKKIWETIEEGATFEGTVKTIKEYGAFVEIGTGVQGLLHVSEMSHQRVSDPQEMLTVGQKIQVQITKYNPANNKISLSMKSLQQDPWDAAIDKFSVDSVVQGTVVRLQPFGAFIELAPGVDGLVHISQLAHRRINHPKEILSVGDQVEAKVTSVDREKKRIGLSMKDISQEGLPPEVEGGVAQGVILEAIVDKIESFGIFVRLPENKRGLIPNAELNAARGSDLNRVHPLESTITVMVQNIDPTGRIRLSQKAMERQKQASEYREYRQQTAKEEKKREGFGTLGDLLNNLKK